MVENLKCASCGANIHGSFCSQCGERKLDPELRKISHLFSDFIAAITSLDGKFINSFFCLIFKPGFNEYNFHRGARIQYLKPISLFLLINVLFVTLMPLNDFYLSFQDQQHQPYSPLIIDWMQSIVSTSGLDEKTFEIQYNQSVKLLARSIIIIGVIFLLPFIVLLFNHKKYYLSDHFVFALNLYSWLLLLMLVVWWFSYAIYFLLNSVFDYTLYPIYIFSLIVPIAAMIYLYMAINKMYQQTWSLTLIKMPIILVGLVFSHFAFRFIQLILTMLTI